MFILHNQQCLSLLLLLLSYKYSCKLFAENYKVHEKQREIDVSEERQMCMYIRSINEAFINARSRSFGISQVIVAVCKIKSANIRGHFSA